MRRPIRHRLIVALLALLIVPLAGYRTAATAHDAPWAPPPPDEASLVTSVWTDLTPEERADGLRQLDPDKAQKLTVFLDQLSRGEWVPVSAGGKVIGKVSPRVVARPRMPRSKLELVPICDEYGNLTGYWGGPLGVIGVSEAKKADLREIAARRGLTPDGKVIGELLGQVPVPPIEILPPVTEPPSSTTTTSTSTTIDPPSHGWPHKPR